MTDGDEKPAGEGKSTVIEHDLLEEVVWRMWMDSCFRRNDTNHFPGSSHGTNLLYDENYGEQVQEILLDFVSDLAK